MFFNLNRRLEESADELNIPLTIYDKLFGSKADHKSFRSFTKKNRSSFQVAFFHSEKDSRFIPIDSMNFPSKEIR